MRRTTIYLDAETEIQLKLESMRRKQPMAEIIREAVTAYVTATPRRPPGGGKFASGRKNIAARSEDLLRRSFGKKDD